MSQERPIAEPANATEARHRMLMIVTVALGVFLANLDVSIVNIVLPSISRTFNAGAGDVSGVTLLYLLTLCSSMPIFGKLNDLFPKKTVFILGYLFFGAASVGCGLSHSLFALHLFRGLQGIGAAALFATPLSIVAEQMPPEMRGRVIGLITVFEGIGFAVGAPLGGWLVDCFGWPWIFFINVPIGIVGIVLAHTYLKGSAARCCAKKISFDIPGAIASFLCLASLIWFLHVVQEAGFSDPGVILCAFLIPVFVILFVLRENHCQDPLVPMVIFKDVRFSLGILACVLVFMTLDGFGFLLPFFFEGVKKLPPDQSGLVFGVFPHHFCFIQLC